MQIPTILKNIFSLSTAEIATKGITFVTYMYLARILDVDGYGTMSSVNVVITYVVALVTLGFRDVCIRDLSKNPSLVQEYFSNILTIKLLISLICLIFLFLYIYFNNFSVLISVSLLLGSIQLIASSIFIDWFFIFREKFGIFAIRNIFVSILTLVGVLIFVKGVSDLPLYFLIVSFSLLISNFFLIKYSGIRILFRFDLILVRKILLQSLPIGVTFFLSTFIDSFGIIYLGFNVDEVSAGLFSSSIKYMILATLPIFVLQSAFASRLSTSILLEDRINVALKHSKILLSIGAIMVSLSFVFSDVIIFIIFGERFMEADNILKILSISLLFYYTIYVSNTPLIYWNKEKVVLFSYIITFFLTIFTTVLLSGRYNAIGASISFIIATIFLTILLSFFLYRLIRRHFILQIVPFLLISFILVSLFRFLGNLFTSNFYILVIPAFLSVLIYFLIINKFYFSSILFKLNKGNSSGIN